MNTQSKTSITEEMECMRQLVEGFKPVAAKFIENTKQKPALSVDGNEQDWSGFRGLPVDEQIPSIELREVAGTWRAMAKHSEVYADGGMYADELDELLSDWIEITESEKTWPEVGAWVVFDIRGELRRIRFDGTPECLEGDSHKFLGSWWRPLMDVDISPARAAA